jgi:L-ribulose-5-phosphate 3-epimerase
MNGLQIKNRLAVCSWSLQAQNAQELLSKIKDTGIRRIQGALDPIIRSPNEWGNLPELLKQQGIELVSGMFGTAGEDYSTLETIRSTGGLVPDDTWEENWSHIQAVAALSARIGLKLVSFHAGFLPHTPADPSFNKLMDRIHKVADIFGSGGIDLAMETGQETAETLREFLQRLDCANVGVNFDPANMILYDKGEPIQAMQVLGPWIRQCHVKDAIRTRVAGTWGEEVPVGAGQVDWGRFLRTLADMGFQGNLVIEREAGTQRVVDIQTAHELIDRISNSMVR